jgi:hypothetical protein
MRRLFNWAGLIVGCFLAIGGVAWALTPPYTMNFASLIAAIEAPGSVTSTPLDNAVPASYSATGDGILFALSPSQLQGYGCIVVQTTAAPAGAAASWYSSIDSAGSVYTSAYGNRINGTGQPATTLTGPVYTVLAFPNLGGYFKMVITGTWTGTFTADYVLRSAPCPLPSQVPTVVNYFTTTNTTITTGGTAQTLWASGVVVNGYEICNPNATDVLWVNDAGSAALANGAGSIELTAAGSAAQCYRTPTLGFPASAVSIVGPTTGDKVTARRW